jgi:predicted CoA-binding protein
MDTHGSGTGEVDFARLFKEIKTIAVVGYSDNPERAGHFVAHYLADHGYEVLAINPRFKEQVNGLACYPNLGAIPLGKQVDVIDVFRSPEFVPQLVEEAA